MISKKGSENFNRIMDGLKDALKTARCNHKESRRTSEIEREWYCPSCGSLFNFNPKAEGWDD